MKLQFDANLSPRLAQRLADSYPGSVHASQRDLDQASDRTVWDFAALGGFTIVSKDSDFHQYSFVLGHPPKVIWIRLGNCTTQAIELLLRDRVDDVRAFLAGSDAAFLALGAA